jgi:hypothetical protein
MSAAGLAQVATLTDLCLLLAWISGALSRVSAGLASTPAAGASDARIFSPPSRNYYWSRADWSRMASGEIEHLPFCFAVA